MDFTKPVNPKHKSAIETGSLFVSDALELYDGAGGGTGFDLAESGLLSIRYLRIEGVAPEWTGGEVDAVSDVRPMLFGESLTIRPENLLDNTSSLHFEGYRESSILSCTIALQQLSGVAKVAITPLKESSISNSYPETTAGIYRLSVGPIGDNSPVNFQATITFSLRTDSRLSNARLVARSGSVWTNLIANTTLGTFTFSLQANADIAIVAAPTPQLMIETRGSGFSFSFLSLKSWRYSLERSTNFINWQTIGQVYASDSALRYFEDTNQITKAQFYKLRAERSDGL
jgi:hypothetical protein